MDVQISPFAAEIANGDTSPVPMLLASKLVQMQTFSYDFLGNMTASSDDAGTFYDRHLARLQIVYKCTAKPNRFCGLYTGGTLTAYYDAAGNLEYFLAARGDTCASGNSSRTARLSPTAGKS
jgi:hypothetical protein